MSLFLAFVLLCQAIPIPDQDAIGQIASKASPIRALETKDSELEPFGKALKGIQVVGMGECTHGSHEVFQIKSRLFRYLAERQGFTILAMESSFPDTVAMDRFVTLGEGTADDAAKKQGFWTWSTEEIRDLLVWMRSFNQSHKKKLRVVGVDMQDELSAWSFLVMQYKDAGLKDPAFDDQLWLAKLRYAGGYDGVVTKAQEFTDAALAKQRAKRASEAVVLLEQSMVVFRQSMQNGKLVGLKEDLAEASENVAPFVKDTLSKMKAFAQSPGLSPETKSLLESVAEQKETPVPASLRKAAASLKQKGAEANRVAAVLTYLALAREAGEQKDIIYRDRAMADNVLWTFRTFKPGAKVMFWGFNSHVSQLQNGGKPMMMGAYLNSAIGAKYYPIGFVFGEGSFRAGSRADGQIHEFSVGAAKPGSLDSLLKAVKMPSFFLNVDRLDSPTRSWLSKPMPLGGVGSSFAPNLADRYYETLPFGSIFRGLIYIDKVTAARALPK